MNVVKSMAGYVKGIENAAVVFTADVAEAKRFASQAAAVRFYKKHAGSYTWGNPGPATFPQV